MNKKTYFTPQTTLVKCHIEGVMQQLSKTHVKDNTGNTSNSSNIQNGGDGGKDDLSKENSGLLWDY